MKQQGNRGANDMSAAGRQAMAGTEERIDVGGYRLCARCAGEGSPAVVIEAGLGEGLSEWAGVQKEVAAFARVCAYDRAGVGRSDPGPKPRTSQQMVKELHALLNNAHLDGPYVLVGHSLGGLNA
jgi:pimeloyl-ACP methyl ester carboxylesterase